jgi:hypothetical protein
VPDALLNAAQRRVKTHTLSGKVFFDAAGAAADLAPHKLPALFIDFETVQMAVPVWKGTRPYQQMPFQFSAHRLSRTGKLTHSAFLSLSGKDPSREFAERGRRLRRHPFVYNAHLKPPIRELVARCCAPPCWLGGWWTQPHRGPPPPSQRHGDRARPPWHQT